MTFEKAFTAGDGDIDELGHVNNAAWVRWIQDIAVAHWQSAGDPAHVDRYVWVVTRHEIDYRGNVGLGETVTAETFIPDPPKGARFDRCVTFRDAAGREVVAARSTWALLDRASGKLLRVSPQVAAPFYAA